MKPGPGQYTFDQNKVKKAVMAFSIGTDKRVDRNFEKSTKTHLVSPTQYQPDSSITKSAASSWGFSKTCRNVVSQMRARTRNPSPDQYQIPSSITDGRKTAMHGRQSSLTQRIKQDYSPGPGSYAGLNDKLHPH